MTGSDICAALQATACDVLSPPFKEDLISIVPRWSLFGVSVPHAVVTPSSASDISAVIAHAIRHGLKIIPAGGGHGPFVPVSPQSIYLSLAKYKSIDLDEGVGTVTIGGGVLTGDVLAALGEKGWYTSVPSSDKVGLVGALLGGLHHPLIGKHGLGSDCVEQFTVIPFTADAQELVLSRHSKNEKERRLFNVLCGAGLGFGVVTSAVVRAWPIKTLNCTSEDASPLHIKALC